MAQPGTLLVVDDDEGIRDFIEATLSDEGYEVRSAPNGRAALELLGPRGPARPGLILLDMRMPVMDGWEFARAYREAAPAGSRAPIVVLTAARDGAGRAAEIAADGYLAKPFGLHELLGTVRQHMAGRP
jgi:DNA-binding response OmpR family regulator